MAGTPAAFPALSRIFDGSKRRKARASRAARTRSRVRGFCRERPSVLGLISVSNKENPMISVHVGHVRLSRKTQKSVSDGGFGLIRV